MSKNGPLVELYMIRHGETEMNKNKHLVGGRSNKTPTTPHGIWQNKRLGRTMLARNIIPDKVFVSPADRTLDTAYGSLGEMGLDIEPVVQDEIQEQSQGWAEGKLREEVYTDEVQAEIKRLGKDFKLSGGESMNEVGLRMRKWITATVASETATELQRYFVYTHGGSIKHPASHILGWDHERTYKTEIDNTSVNLFVFQDDELSVAYLNRDAEDV
jgi:broad specificity phosphatase PhoE